jgi:hypothetical protein
MVVTLGDAYTTWACLHEPVPGWDVVEANPASAWLFGFVGLVPGLVVDGIVTVLAVGWIGRTKKVTPKFKTICLLLAIAVSGWAVYNNYQGMIEMRLI